MNPPARSQRRRRWTLLCALSVMLVVLVPALPVAAASPPYLVKDINASQGSSPFGLTALGGKLFFTADDGVHGRELWKSNGTDAGTVRVRDIRPGLGGSNPFNLTAIGNLLYFSANDGVHGRELWASDGTAAGTRLVKDIRPGAGGSDRWGFTLASADNGHGSAVYFSADDGSTGRELWRTDGTAAGTRRVLDLKPGPEGSDPGQFVDFAGQLFFVRRGPAPFDNNVLYRTDGTGAGTNPVLDQDGQRIKGYISSLTVVGPRLFFGLDTAELWRSNGNLTGTRKIADLDPYRIAGVGDTAFISTGTALWKSGGTPATTELVRDFSESGATDLIDVGGTLYFSSDPGFWTSDGTTAGTQPVETAVQHDGSLAPLGSVLYFDGWQNEEQRVTPAPHRTLWRTDGTDTGTYSVSPTPESRQLGQITVVDGALFFVASGDGHGLELWRYVP